MIPSEGQWKASFGGVLCYDLTHCLTYARNQSRVLQNANWSIGNGDNVLKLVMSVEKHIPSEVLYLVYQASLYKMNWASINARARLRRGRRLRICQNLGCRAYLAAALGKRDKCACSVVFE